MGKKLLTMPGQSLAVLTASQVVSELPDEDTTLMTAANIRRLCKEHGLYLMPNLNDRLYLQDQGYRKIENLEEYGRLRALWLDSNAIHAIENLEHLSELQCLYMRHNSLEDLIGVEVVDTLETVDVSGNFITSLDDIATLPNWRGLRTLDLSFNKLAVAAEQDPWSFIQFLEQMQSLEVLNMEGNPIVHQIPGWRMCVVARLPHIRFLDGQAVTDADRHGATQWAKDMTSSFGLPVWQWKFTGSS